MSLGTNQLSDDQLLELLKEACNELAVRAAPVRDAAQKVIVTGAESIKIHEKVFTEAAVTVRREYEKQLYAETYEHVQLLVKNGSAMLADSGEEARLAIEAEKKAFASLTAQAVQMLGPNAKFELRIRGSAITITTQDNATLTVRHTLNEREVRDLSQLVARIIGI